MSIAATLSMVGMQSGIGVHPNISRSFYNIKFNLIQRDRYGDKDKGEI